LKSAPMAIAAMALLQQHDARRDILIEPRRSGVHRSKLGAFRTGGIRNWGRSELGRSRAVKTNRLVRVYVCLSARTRM